MIPESKTPTHSGQPQPFWALASISLKASRTCLLVNSARSPTTPLCFGMDALFRGQTFTACRWRWLWTSSTSCVMAVAGISERRTYWLLSGRDDQSGIPAYLAREAGLESGLMIAQYTAAALVNEIRVAALQPHATTFRQAQALRTSIHLVPPLHGAQHALDLATKVLAVEPCVRPTRWNCDARFVQARATKIFLVGYVN